jgi:hypothetical protein
MSEEIMVEPVDISGLTNLQLCNRVIGTVLASGGQPSSGLLTARLNSIKIEHEIVLVDSFRGFFDQIMKVAANTGFINVTQFKSLYKMFIREIYIKVLGRPMTEENHNVFAES